MGLASVLVVGLLGGVGYAAAWPGALLNDAAAVSAVREARAGAFVEELSTGAFVDWVEAEGLIVDARYPAAYAAGHVPGAMNVPVSWTEAQTSEWVAGLAGVLRDRGEVAIYCQSSGCDYDTTVAARLYRAGFKEGGGLSRRLGWLAGAQP